MENRLPVFCLKEIYAAIGFYYYDTIIADIKLKKTLLLTKQNIYRSFLMFVNII